MKYSIGQVSKMFDISLDTLRHYDKIGLLKPKVNLQNRYRYYENKHIEQLMFILSAKEMEIPLSEITDVIESENLIDYKKLLVKQHEMIQQKIKHLQVLDRVILRRTTELDEMIQFRNIDHFAEIPIVHDCYSFYYVSMKDSEQDIECINMLEDIYQESLKFHEAVEWEDYSYTSYQIVDNNQIVENNEHLFIVENKITKPYLEKYFLDKGKEVSKITLQGKCIKVKYYGTQKQILEYVLSLNEYYKINNKKKIYIRYYFYLHKSVNSEYFCEILYEL